MAMLGGMTLRPRATSVVPSSGNGTNSPRSTATSGWISTACAANTTWAGSAESSKESPNSNLPTSSGVPVARRVSSDAQIPGGNPPPVTASV